MIMVAFLLRLKRLGMIQGVINKNMLIFLVVFLSFGLANAQDDNNSQLNVVLITLTATRADHLMTYGYIRKTAPHIEELANGSAIFDQAIAQSYWTLPSQASILTSKYVFSHGVYGRNQKLSESELTLPEILKLYGYKTAAFVGGLDMLAFYGLNQGFDCYYDDSKEKPMGSFNEIMPEALGWLKENKGRKFFLFLQSYDVHPPYHHPRPYEGMYGHGYSGAIDKCWLDYNFLKNIRNGTLFFKGKKMLLTKTDINHIIAHYDEGIAYADKFIGDLLEEIHKLNLSDKTIIIITSEHGEELLDHGTFDRFGEKNLYEEVIHVPLIIKHPHADLKKKRIENQVQLIDIMPTILDFLGIPVNKEAQGVSLAPLIEGGLAKKDFNQFAYSEASINKRAIRTTEWKLISDTGKYKLYNLKNDKMEINNLAGEKPELVYEFMQYLSEWHKIAKTDKSPDETRVELSEGMKKKLRDAGYW